MKEYKKLEKNAKWVMLSSSMIFSVVSTLILVVVWRIFGKDLPELMKYILLAVGAGIWLIALLEPFVRYERYRYRFTEEEIDIKEGFLFVERNVVPIERLHKISMLSGPLDRVFGLAKVIVTTAGGDVTIRFLEVSKAEEIVENLKNRINTYAVAQRMEQISQETEGEKDGKL